MKTPRSADEATSATAFFHGFPVSVWTISPNSRSLARSSAAARPRISPRRGAGSRPHGSAAAAALATARSTSAAAPRATLATTRSSIGQRFSNTSPFADATSASSIQWRICWGYIIAKSACPNARRPLVAQAFRPALGRRQP
jgi:hypothetical protein